MINQILISIIYLQSFSISNNNEIEKDCFRVFVKSLYSRGILRKEASTFYVIFDNIDNKNYFIEKVKYENKILILKNNKPDNKADVLRINTITKLGDNKISINFTSIHSGVTYEGTIFLGIENNKAIFLNASVILAIE
jgi:hypothetical protein